MAMLDYTTYDDIRAVLGVSSDELEDSTLSLTVYEYGLSSELRSINRAIPTDHATVAAKSESTWTNEERDFIEVMSLFSTYAVARHLLTSLPLFSPKEISDGKASMVRYSINPYEETIKRVEGMYQRYRDELETVYSAYKVETAPSRPLRTFMSVASPSSDPITG